MKDALRLGWIYHLYENDKEVLVTTIPGLDDNSKYFLTRHKGEPSCYSFKEFKLNSLGNGLRIEDRVEVPLEKDQKEIAEKILSSRGL